MSPTAPSNTTRSFNASFVSPAMLANTLPPKRTIFDKTPEPTYLHFSFLSISGSLGPN